MGPPSNKTIRITFTYWDDKKTEKTSPLDFPLESTILDLLHHTSTSLKTDIANIHFISSAVKGVWRKITSNSEQLFNGHSYAAYLRSSSHETTSYLIKSAGESTTKMIFLTKEEILTLQTKYAYKRDPIRVNLTIVCSPTSTKQKESPIFKTNPQYAGLPHTNYAAIEETNKQILASAFYHKTIKGCSFDSLITFAEFKEQIYRHIQRENTIFSKDMIEFVEITRDVQDASFSGRNLKYTVHHTDYEDLPIFNRLENDYAVCVHVSQYSDDHRRIHFCSVTPNLTGYVKTDMTFRKMLELSVLKEGRLLLDNGSYDPRMVVFSDWEGKVLNYDATIGEVFPSKVGVHVMTHKILSEIPPISLTDEEVRAHTEKHIGFVTQVSDLSGKRKDLDKEEMFTSGMYYDASIVLMTGPSENKQSKEIHRKKVSLHFLLARADRKDETGALVVFYKQREQVGGDMKVNISAEPFKQYTPEQNIRALTKLLEYGYLHTFKVEMDMVASDYNCLLAWTGYFKFERLSAVVKSILQNKFVTEHIARVEKRKQQAVVASLKRRESSFLDVLRAVVSPV